MWIDLMLCSWGLEQKKVCDFVTLSQMNVTLALRQQETTFANHFKFCNLTYF